MRRSPTLLFTAALLAVTACGGGKKKTPDAAAGAGGHSGASGQSGAGGQSGAAGNSTCPPIQPAAGTACTGTGICSYQDRCNECGACCSVAFACTNGSYVYYGANDACVVVTCQDAGLGGRGGTGGVGGAGGTGGASTGGVGGASGAGGAGADGYCPAERPANGTQCNGYYLCKYPETCRCGVCCGWTHRCDNGTFIDLGVSNECYFVTCADAGTVCRPGNGATCNDSPNWAGIYGRCTDAGTCECFDSGINPETGRCYQAVPPTPDASSAP